jgi:hypothetical protein
MSEMETKAEATETPAEQPAAPAVQMVDVSVSVPKEINELAVGLSKLVAAAKQALADGFQPTQDLPVLLVEAVRELPAMVGGLDMIDDEFKADKGKFVLALSIALDEVI